MDKSGTKFEIKGIQFYTKDVILTLLFVAAIIGVGIYIMTLKNEPKKENN